MNNHVFNNIFSGTKVVGTTPVQVGSQVVNREVTLLAGSGNFGSVYVGQSGVSTSGTAAGYPLASNVQVTLSIDNTDKIWAVSQSGNNLLHWILT